MQKVYSFKNLCHGQEDDQHLSGYLFTPAHKYYRYRLFFLQSGIAHYLEKVVLEQGIADEINKGGLIL